MSGQEMIEAFYSAFARHDHRRMAACYHERAEFNDPAFGSLNAAQVKAMWRMLIERSGGHLQVSFRDVVADASNGSTVWEARYIFSQTGRSVANVIHARFEFMDGLIYRHIDTFSLWRWSRQALGFPGLLFGFTAFFRARLQKQTGRALASYMKHHD